MCGSSIEKHKVLGKRLNTSQGRHPSKKTGIATTIMRCNICGLVYPQPLPIPANLQDHYDLPPSDYWTEEDMNSDFKILIPELERMKEIIHYQPGMRSLDIGAGRGTYMKACENIGFEAWGCEPSESFYHRLIKEVGISPDRLQMGKVEDIEFHENHFHYISMIAVLEHLPDPSLALNRAMRWLKPGGVMCVEVPSSGWLISKIFNFYYRMNFLNYTSHLSPMHPPYHLYEFGLESFLRHASIHGFSVHSCKYFVCETFMPKFLDRPLKSIMRKTKTGMDLYLYLQK